MLTLFWFSLGVAFLVGAVFGALSMAVVKLGAMADRRFDPDVNHVNRDDDENVTRFPPRFPPR